MKKTIISLVSFLLIAGTFGFAACGEKPVENNGVHEHEWVKDTVRSGEPTCGDWATAYYTCEGCGGTRSEVLPATGAHDYGGDGVCDVCGYIDMSGMTMDEAIAEYGFYFEDADDNGRYSTNDLVYFGSYPQNLIADETIYNDIKASRDSIEKGISMRGITRDDQTYAALSSMAGALPTAENPSAVGWTAYAYYENGELLQNYAFYKDAEYNGTKYRGVYMLDYRNDYIGDVESGGGNGYNLETVYWFEYTPITWIVLDYRNGNLLLNSKFNLDYMPYQNLTEENSAGDTVISGTQTYANDWAASTVRSFLNGEFYDLSFSETEKTLIEQVTLDNRTSGYSAVKNQENAYQVNQSDTQDKVFLLAYQDYINEVYGLALPATAKSRSFSPYATIQGLRPSGQGKTSDGESACMFFIRSASAANSGSVLGVSKTGSIETEDRVDASSGILPSLYLKIK